MMQPFEPCLLPYIKSTCKGRCCERSQGGTLITIHPSEEARITALGGEVVDGMLRPIGKYCPFKRGGLCTIHDQKPLGCRFSPFTLTNRGTLIVRNRYRMLKCYKTPNSVPAYKAHPESLRAIFGPVYAQKIFDILDDGLVTDNFTMPVTDDIYNILIDNDNLKRKHNE